MRSAKGDAAFGGDADDDDNDSKRHRGGHCDGRSNWLDDEFGSDFGFNFSHGGDFFPAAPWTVSAEIDWGTLGHERRDRCARLRRSLE